MVKANIVVPELIDLSAIEDDNDRNDRIDRMIVAFGITKQELLELDTMGNQNEEWFWVLRRWRNR